MNRLNVINFINPSWHKQISEFLTEHPEFNKLIPIVALDEYPTGFNKNPHESEIDAPRNIFETIVYGVSHSGLNVEDGRENYLKSLRFVRNCNVFSENMDFPCEENSRKVAAYQKLINTLLENNILVNEMKYEHLNLAQELNCIPDSTFELIHLLYADIDSESVIPYKDPYFVKGIETFYKLEEEPSYDKMREIIQTWRNKKVGVMFIIQYAHYSEFV